jgi:hypothetical protein
MANEQSNLQDGDVLLSRLLDGRGRAADWQRLREATAADAVVWDRLIGNAGDQDLLGDVVTAAGDRAVEMSLLPAPGCVDALPVPLALADAPRPDGRRADRGVRSARLGWLVAACLALGMVSLSIKQRIGGENAAVPIAAGVNLDNWSAKDFMNNYKDRASKDGTLVTEMPQRVVLETRPCADGKGYEVLYIRQFIERTVVDDLYKLGVDDAGRPAMVPASLEKPRPAGAM